MNIIFLGAPGAGKGTHAEIIKEKLGIPSISTGDIIRAELKKQSEFSKKMKEYTDAGQLVPDEIVIDIIKERISHEDCKLGFILDGFPRTPEQAEALENMGIKINKVINLEVSDELVYTRMAGREVCQECGAVFNSITDKKPRKQGICDICDSSLVRRSDDQEAVVKKRLEVYHEQTEPLVKYYQKKDLLVNINGNNHLKTASRDILEVLSVT
ncbi:MAG: adenylate kinase [Candidatus Improbicoccus devescovinae]|nr:MAG: adenylate kinase [Candidatus Improbicoccus devescovinae]